MSGRQALEGALTLPILGAPTAAFAAVGRREQEGRNQEGEVHCGETSK